MVRARWSCEPLFIFSRKPFDDASATHSYQALKAALGECAGDFRCAADSRLMGHAGGLFGLCTGGK
eukprot:3962337-Pyramimonas_sp.AAC.2